MAVLFWIIVVLICLSFPYTSSVNYCGARMCEHPNSHTFCVYSPGPGPGCTGSIHAALSVEEKARILVRINKRRSDAASGLLKNLPAAADMLKLRWVEELAREAQLWADQCSPIQIPEESDECRDLYSTTVGQCIASVIGEAPGLKPASMVDVWYLESMKFHWNATREPAACYVPRAPDNSFEYADFTQMMWSKVYMVGCGRARFMSPWRGHLRSVERLVCNFAPRGPPPGATLWTPGIPASACPDHSAYDRDMPSLCTYHPSYVNSPYIRGSDGTIKEEEILLKTILEIEQNTTLDYKGSLDEIYLTKLAIATIAPSYNALRYTPHYGSLERRNLQQIMDLSHNVIDVDLNQTNEDFNAHLRVTSALDFEKNISATPISLVGRPKTYDIDELSNAANEKDTANLYRTRRKEETLKVTVDKDIYLDYYNSISRASLEPIPDIKQPSMEAAVRLPSESVVQVSDEEHSNEHTQQKLKEYTEKAVEYTHTLYSETNKDVKNSKATEVPFIVTTNDATVRQRTPINISVLLAQPLNKTEEEYLSDPETAREIQAALDRMENELSQTITLPPLLPLASPSQLSQGKVRRDLRDVEPGALANDNSDPEDQNNTYDDRIPRSTAEILKKNNITDEGPIYRMMQHYVPYFNQYKSSFYGESSSSAHCRSIKTSLLVIVALSSSLSLF